MSDQTDKLIPLLKPFGLSTEEIEIYLSLLENNTSSALAISRNLHLGRTKVYRILDKLIEKELVIQQYNENGFKFKASHPSQLSFILSKKETEIFALRKSLPETLNILENYINIDNSDSQILYYRGQEGLSRVNWNLLNAKKEYLSYEVDNAESYLSQKEANKIRQALSDKKILNRMITNKKNILSFINVDKSVLKWWQVKHIPSNIINIKTDIFIYNDIFTICHYLDNHDVFCLEIKNQFLVNMQKDIFENLWSQSIPIDKI